VGGKTESLAKDNFLGFLRESLNCITDSYLTAFRQSDKLFKVWFDPPSPVTLRNGGRGYVSVTQIFKVVSDKERGGFKAKTREYSYRFSADEDVASPGILAYHWHPHEFEVRFPHLHVTSLNRVHFPTSRVCVEDFILLLIDYYDVKPILKEKDWKRILQKNKAAFDQMATWKIQHPLS
jgi:hypothetical protein